MTEVIFMLLVSVGAAVAHFFTGRWIGAKGMVILLIAPAILYVLGLLVILTAALVYSLHGPDLSGVAMGTLSLVNYMLFFVALPWIAGGGIGGVVGLIKRSRWQIANERSNSPLTTTPPS